MEQKRTNWEMTNWALPPAESPISYLAAIVTCLLGGALVGVWWIFFV
jgi:hypothetical protein